MKFKTILTALVTFLAISFSSAEEWKISGEQMTSKKKAAPIVVAEDPKLAISASVSDDQLTIAFSDGKQKFGQAVITIKKGDITYRRPRLKLTVPLEKVKAVKENAPLLVIEFAHKETEFKMHLVKSGSGDLPDLVVTQK